MNIYIGVAAEVVLPLANLTLIENIWLKCDIMTPVFLTISEPFMVISVVDPDPYWECGSGSMRIEVVSCFSKKLLLFYGYVLDLLPTFSIFFM